MNCPPSKRPRRLNDDLAQRSDDPFGDEEDFTQDDLDEIDVIASQAFPQGEHRAQSRPTVSCTFGCSSRGMPSRDSLVNRPQEFVSEHKDAYRTLEFQHAELKRKLKEVEEEIMSKNGEIHVLRDSLKGAQQEKEAQRQTQLLLEIQRQKEQSDKEKELNKKVQSLQTELQFKEAEINEIKSKLHSSEKKKSACLLSRHSPKMQSVLTQLNDGSGSSTSPVAGGFITKEIFDTRVPSKEAPGKTGEWEDRGSPSSKQETSPPDPFMSKRPAPPQFQGSILLGLLLQQPLSPSSLGLCHLLSMRWTSNGLSTGCRQRSNVAVSGNATQASLNQVQTLALNGLNMLSQSQTQASSSTKDKSSGLGAVLLLPLLDYHLCRLSERLESHCSATAGGSDSAAMSSISLTSIASTDEPGRVEGTGLTGFSVEEIGLAALRLLYLLVSHSDEVVEAVLSKESLSTDAEKKDSVKALCSQNALLQSVLQLCEGGIGNSIGSHMEKLVLSALETLCVLIQRARHSHVNCLKRALQRIGTRFSTDCGLRMASDYVRVLMSVCEHPDLAQHLCFQHDHCVFLKLFQFIRTRRDNQAKQEDWVQLDLLVVRLLSRMMMQLESWLTRHHSSCHCHTEMVQTMVIVFHRQWLDLCGSQQPTNSTGPELSAPWWHSTNVSLLRECLLLLHWLLLHHSSFSQSCRPLLHLYDQVIPAVQDILRRIPERSESEEVALEEICRSDGDEADDVDIDTVS
eukprot:XP_011611911.1 PREDICTED: ATR-interacting protein [Takifugu rubripes]